MVRAVEVPVTTRRARRRRFLRRGVIALGALAVLGAAAVASLGFEVVAPDGAEPLELPEEGFSHAALDRTLSAHVHADGVDYAALARERTDLRRYVATLEVAGPETTPERFPSEDSRLAYYIDAYNALVLLIVAQRWPIDSVQDVDGPIEPVDGFGFFYGLWFRLDGHWTNLWYLEHDILREEFEDARIHAAIVCAARSCPVLRDEAYVPERLAAQLDDAMRRFVAAEDHVRIDDGRDRIVLSAIFEWFEEDFTRDARRLGAGSSMLDYVAHYAGHDRREAIDRARAAGYDVVHGAYDWRLNAARTRD